MSERQAKTPTLRALLPSRLVPEDMLSEWQGPNLPNTKNYAPPPDSMRGRMGDVLMQGIAALGGFTGLPMGGEESKAALLGELLAAGMPLVGGVKALRGVAGAKKLPYKAARESLRDVADANFGYGIPVGNRTVNIDTLRGGMSAAADDAAKVNKIAQQMSSKDGYIERLIVDQNGNVIEGQHRLRALQSLGVQDVPVSVIQDYSDVVETLQKQGMRPEHARQVTQQTHDMLKESGSAAKVRSDYNLSGQYEAQFESALDLMDAPKAKQGIKAFHGSPHDFDQFSLSKIGTGEGNQAYGHGLYFAESPEVAHGYRTKLSDSAIDTVKADVYDIAGERMWKLKATGPNGTVPVSNQYLRDSELEQWLGQPAAERLIKGGDGTYKDLNIRPGKTYEVSINADPEDFLDWDAPLSQQSERVRQAFTRLHGPEDLANYADAPGREWHASLSDHPTADPAASKRLRKAGIPGIKYLDGASRSAGQGSRNYVVFDDKLISIVKKYGIAGALSAGAINELEARQLQAQGYQ